MEGEEREEGREGGRREASMMVCRFGKKLTNSSC